MKLDDWNEKPLGAYVELVKGLTYLSSDYSDEEHHRKFITLKCVSKAGGFNAEGIKYYKGVIDQRAIVKTGDLIIANTDLTRDGDIVGCPIVIPEEIGRDQPIISMDLSRLEIKKNAPVNRDYLYYQLMMPQARRFMRDNSGGSTVLHLKTSAVGDLRIPFPSLETQKNIAQILSSVDCALEQTQALIAKYQRVKNGLMQDLLTKGIDEHGRLRHLDTHEFKDSVLGKIPLEWEVFELGELFETQLGKMLSKEAKKGLSPFRYLANRNVQWDKVDTSDLEEMDFSDFEREKYALKKGDLLVCEGGEVGRTALWNDELTDCYFQKAIHRLRPRDNRILPKFMLPFMRYAARTGLLSNFTSQTSIAHLTKEKLVLLPVPVPSIPEQNRIVDLFEQNDHQIFYTKTQLKKLEILKTGLMQDLLSGKVSVEQLLEKTLTLVSSEPKKG